MTPFPRALSTRRFDPDQNSCTWTIVRIRSRRASGVASSAEVVTRPGDLLARPRGKGGVGLRSVYGVCVGCADPLDSAAWHGVVSTYGARCLEL